jgi:plastocyanin
MERKWAVRAAVWLVVLIMAPACASRQPLVTISPSQGETVITMKASDFKFEPNNIRAYQGNEVLLKVENVSHKGHNFTIKDPRGNTVLSVPLPPKETVEMKFDLSETGIYEFFCDKPFHAAFGMKGRIEADR